MNLPAHSDRTGRVHRRADVSRHLFRVGQKVTMKPRFGLSAKPGELFSILATLPARDNSPQYRIRSDEERHERVATEDSLEPVDEKAAADGATLIERTFGSGRGAKATEAGAAKDPAAA